jgi:hypothetical protein
MTFRDPRLLFLSLAIALPLFGQDDVTTQFASSAYGGGYITGPANNPLSFLNGPAYRTFGLSTPYDFPDLHPALLLDRQLPKWILFGWEERFRYEGYHNSGFKLHNNDSYLLLRSRLQMTLQPVELVKAIVQVQDARPFMQKPPWGPPNLNAWDLKLAYIQIGDPEKNWFNLRVGRQMINYNNTIMADSEWRNQARSFDAAVANLHFERVRVGIFAASVVVPLAEGVSHHQEGNNIYGVYGSIDRVAPSSTLEPFVLWRVRDGVSEHAYGIRFKALALRSLDYSAEGILERSNTGVNNAGVSNNGVRAWATTFGAGYRFRGLPAKPRVFGQFDYASGGPGRTFDTMYPTAHDRFGITDLVGWQNIVARRGGLTLEPRNRWSVTGQYVDLSLASAFDSLYNSSGAAIVTDAAGKSGTHVGQEFDFYTWYELNRHMNVGFGIGHLQGGEFLQKTTKGPNYNYPYFAINFKDNGKAR